MDGNSQFLSIPNGRLNIAETDGFSTTAHGTGIAGQNITGFSSLSVSINADVEMSFGTDMQIASKEF